MLKGTAPHRCSLLLRRQSNSLSFCDRRNLHPKALQEGAQVHVGLVGEFGANRVSPRSLLAEYQGRLVCVEGIVTKASVVRPKWVKSVHYCAATQKETTREYRCACRSNSFQFGSEL